LLARKDLTERSLSCRYLAAHCYIKQGRYEQALQILGDENPTHLITSSHNTRRKLAHLNGNPSRHVTLRNGKTSHRSDRIEYSEERERDREQEKDIKFQAAMCYLRGLCFAKRNAFERARECYKDAVRIDVQCFEAFDQLMKNSFMSPAEELAFLEELDFESVQHDDPSVAQEAAHFTKLLYTTRLSKYASPTALTDATETLSTHYNLADNPDLLLTRAEVLYTQCRFHEALAITSSILNSQTATPIDSSSSAPGMTSSLGHNPTLYPLHLACLYETSSHNTLFLLSHTLSQHAPHEPYTYLAIGTYYLSTQRISEARRFFSKASLMDPHSSAAWIGFAHTFAAEGEHDQAIAAYSTAARLFQGSHLPQLFLGMQHLALNNMQLALEYCVAAYEMSSGTTHTGEGFDPAKTLGGNTGGDPLVLNELGVILYHQSNLQVAVKLFRQSLALATELGCSPTAWVATRANLAHALRRLGRLDEALAEFDECLRTITGGSPFNPADDRRVEFYNAGPSALADTAGGGGSSAVAGYDDRNLIGSIHTSRGLVLLSMPSRTHEAVLALHEAVRVLGGDASGGGVAGTLLGRAVEIWALEEDGDVGAVTQELETPHATQQSPRRRGGLGNSSEGRAIRANDNMSNARKIELGLDEAADEMLDATLSSTLPRGR
jgi:anaphase-promoting complex subunit 6